MSLHSNHEVESFVLSEDLRRPLMLAEQTLNVMYMNSDSTTSKNPFTFSKLIGYGLSDFPRGFSTFCPLLAPVLYFRSTKTPVLWRKYGGRSGKHPFTCSSISGVLQKIYTLTRL